MSAFLKLQKVRALLAKEELKKSGFNKHSGYSYLELSDFLRKAMDLMENHKICGVFTFADQLARLEVVDSEEPSSKIIFEVPVVQAQLPKAQPIQSLGASISYLRRYLWVMALELAVDDEVDADQVSTPPAGGLTPPFKPISRPAPATAKTSVPLEAIPDDLPPPSIEERKTYIARILTVPNLHDYWRSLPEEVASNPQVLAALSERKAQLTGKLE